MKRARLIVLTVAAALLGSIGVAAAVSSRATAGPKLQGGYEVRVAGDVEGTGNAAVGGPNVNIVCKVRDASGVTDQLKFNSLDLRSNRFTGTGSSFGEPVTISGRVEPSSTAGPRILATVEYQNSKRVARIVGTRRGS